MVYELGTKVIFTSSCGSIRHGAEAEVIGHGDVYNEKLGQAHKIQFDDGHVIQVGEKEIRPAVKEKAMRHEDLGDWFE